MAMILCPKTVFALIGTDLGKRGECPLPGEMTYQEACVCAIGESAVSIPDVHQPERDKDYKWKADDDRD